MSVRDLIPWRRGNDPMPAVFQDDRNPFASLHREVNRLIDDAFRGFDTRWPSLGTSFGESRWGETRWPNVEIAETDKEWKVCAEVPGMDEKDIEVTLDDHTLTLRGEKRSEVEDKEKQFSERYYGHFERRIPLGAEVEADKAEARFKNGVLTVTVPKTAQAASRAKRIAISKS